MPHTKTTLMTFILFYTNFRPITRYVAAITNQGYSWDNRTHSSNYSRDPYIAMTYHWRNDDVVRIYINLIDERCATMAQVNRSSVSMETQVKHRLLRYSIIQLWRGNNENGVYRTDVSVTY